MVVIGNNLLNDAQSFSTEEKHFSELTVLQIHHTVILY